MSQANVSARLSAMMFIQFFIWGAWYVSVGNFMRAHGMGDDIYWAYTVGPIAAIISPFFLGFVADRFFATERVLGVLHFVGGGLMLLAPTAAEHGSTVFILVLSAHMLCYMPTLGLTNTLAFHHITSQEKQFPLIRMFGTIGWIAANLVISAWLEADKAPVQFQVAAAAAIGLGFFSFGLPHTPPPAAGRKASVRAILGLDAARELSDRSFVVFLGCSFLVCIPLAAYYNYSPIFVGAAGFEKVAATMSLGQVAEVLFMFVMPFFFARFGVKWMLAIGMAAWVLRYGLFAAAAPDGIAWMILGGILLHGICYDFFFVTGQIYTDQRASPEIRGQAQGLLVLITQGLGMLIGAQLGGRIYNAMVSGEGDAFRASFTDFWIVPCITAGAVLLAFLLLFRNSKR